MSIVFCWQNLDGADGLDTMHDVMRVDLAMNLLMLDFVDLWFYCFLGYRCTSGKTLALTDQTIA